MKEGKKHALFFDGSCGLCRGTIAVIRDLDLLGRVRYCDAFNDWALIEKEFPHLNQPACLADMHVVTPKGKTVSGFDAYRALAWVLPFGWLFLGFLYLPLVRLVGRQVYKTAALRRSRGSCSIK